jgi:autotransporter-associated beta strand protein
VLISGGDNRLPTTGIVTLNSGTLDTANRFSTISKVILNSGVLTGTTASINATTGFEVYSGTVSGRVGGTGYFLKDGAGTVTITSSNNTYSGKTLVQSGTLAFTTGNATATAAQALGANASLDLGVAGVSSGLLDYTGTGAATLAKNINALGHGNDTIRNSGTGLLTLAGTLTKNGTTLTLAGGANGINVTGSIVGANANSDLVVDGGNVTLSSANTYNGPTIINSGTLTAAAAGALGSTTNIDINGGSLLVTAADAVSDSAGINLNGGRLAVSGNFNENVGALTLSSNSVIDFSGFSGTLRFSGVSSWLPSANLAIWNWSGTTYWGTQVNNYAAPSNLVFTNNSSISSNLANISFYSDSGSSFVGSGFEMSGFSGGGSEIIAVPEPEAWFAAAVLTAAAAYTAIRRRRKSFRFPLRRTPA